MTEGKQVKIALGRRFWKGGSWLHSDDDFSKESWASLSTLSFDLWQALKENNFRFRGVWESSSIHLVFVLSFYFFFFFLFLFFGALSQTHAVVLPYKTNSPAP